MSSLNRSHEHSLRCSILVSTLKEFLSGWIEEYNLNECMRHIQNGCVKLNPQTLEGY